jgi:hypothetical protein
MGIMEDDFAANGKPIGGDGGIRERPPNADNLEVECFGGFASAGIDNPQVLLVRLGVFAHVVHDFAEEDGINGEAVIGDQDPLGKLIFRRQVTSRYDPNGAVLHGFGDGLNGMVDGTGWGLRSWRGRGR